jgi:hypothetical protein
MTTTKLQKIVIKLRKMTKVKLQKIAQLQRTAKSQKVIKSQKRARKQPITGSSLKTTPLKNKESTVFNLNTSFFSAVDGIYGSY